MQAIHSCVGCHSSSEWHIFLGIIHPPPICRCHALFSSLTPSNFKIDFNMIVCL